MKYFTVKGIHGDFEISKVAFGTGSEIKNLSRGERFELFDYYYEMGGNVLDTAPGYCGGTSEKDIGAWMKERGNRDKIRISTKACHAFAGEPSRLTLKDMLEDLNLSLSQLDTDYIDLFWIHNDDPEKSVEEIIDAVNEVVATGKVNAVGCSNWTIDRIAAANKYAKENGKVGFFANQSQWSLAVPNPDYAVAYNAIVMDEKSYNWYLNNDVAVFAFSSVAQGFFSIVEKGGVEALSERSRGFWLSDDNLVRLEHVKDFMKKNNVSAAGAALGYITNNRLPGVAITSATGKEILKETLTAADTTMTADEADALHTV
ncbi:MAG: aldo/keto reductase [Lachnospiraceae bacterium]|nr:aldo/keto reductase [Lachnospiraceae bacterium]